MCCGSGPVLSRVRELFYEATLLKGTMKAEKEIGKEFSRTVRPVSADFIMDLDQLEQMKKKEKVHEQAAKNKK